MKPITILIKDVGEVRDKFRRECECVKFLEDGNKYYIKRDLKING